jgi:hypothetical protein
MILTASTIIIFMSADYVSKLIKTMLKIPDSDSYEFQPQFQTSQDISMAVFRMRESIINAIAKKRV